MAHLAAEGIGAAAIDLRGHGGLVQSADFPDQGLWEMVEDVREAAQSLPSGIRLAGHSLGARVALHAAAGMSFRGLALLAPAARSRVLPRFSSGRSVAPPPADRAGKWFLSGGGVEIANYLARLCPESPRFLNDCFHDAAEVDPGAVTCPILCLSGGKDGSPLHPAGQDEEIAARFRARLYKIPQSGHCMMMDGGRRLAVEHILQWISET